MTPGTARADLVRLAGERRWSRTTSRGAVPARRSAVLLLFGLLEPSDHADPGSADVDLLLTRRSDELRHHPGQIAFPGGGLDPGEGALDAAIREAHEETGLDPAGVDPLGALEEVPLPVSGNVVTPVLAWWRAPSALRANGTETAEVYRVPVHELLDPAHRGVVVLERGARRFQTPAFDVPAVPGAVVWGFTAFVLDGVFDALGWSVPWDGGRVLPLPTVAQS